MAQTEQYRRVGKFELHELIGEGAMGVVWKAYDSVLRRYVALKLLGSSIGRSRDARERFLREARAAGVLQHPNIVTIYDLGESGGQLFIAMELVDGRDLSAAIATSEPLSLERKLDIVIEVLDALAYAHNRGVIHRDIKPSNVRIAADGAVKIMDFGIARLQSADVSGSGAIVGTPSYMAPEQITNGPVTPATDLFAAGCLLYELLSYRKPFEGETIHGVMYQVLTTDPRPLRTMAPSIPAALERVVVKAMNKVPEERYDSARQLQAALLSIRAALSGPSQTTERLGPRWTPLPAPVLRLISHVRLRSRVFVLSLLAAMVLLLLILSRGPAPAPTAAPAVEATPAGVASPTLDLLAAEPAPPGAQPAVRAQRDSAIAARARARLAGAMKNNVPSVLLAETVLLTAEQALRAGAVPRAANGYVTAVSEYRRAQGEAEQLRREAETVLVRARPMVASLANRPEASRAATSLARAESLFTALDYTLAKLAALDAEQTGLAAGVAAPSPQPPEARRAIDVLLGDLERAVGSEQVTNLKVLMDPPMSAGSAADWAAYFRARTRLTAHYRIDQFTPGSTSASAVVQAEYGYVPQEGGALRQDRPRLSIRFNKTKNGWRVATVRCVASCR